MCTVYEPKPLGRGGYVMVKEGRECVTFHRGPLDTIMREEM